MLPAWRDKWRQIATNTTPTNHALAEKGVRLAYKQANLPPPTRIIWQSDPSAAAQWLFHNYPHYQLIHHTVRLKFNQERIDKAHTYQRLWHQFTHFLHQRHYQLTQTRYRRQFPRLIDGHHPWLNKRVGYAILSQCNQALRQAITPDLWTEIVDALTIPDLLTTNNPRHNPRLHLHSNLQLNPFYQTVFWGAINRATNPKRDLEKSRNISLILGRAIYGFHDAFRLIAQDYCHHILNLPQAQPSTGLRLVAEHAGWWWPTPDFCLLTPRPTTFKLDDNQRFHAADGPALAYDNGWQLYAWRDIQIPSWYITHPEKITTRLIERTANIEIRRLLIERYNPARYLRHTKAQLIHHDQYGQLYRQDIPAEAEPRLFILVTNTTPEPDGTHKKYMLRVPPHITTAHAAVAWTAGLSPHHYTLHAES